VTISVTAGTVDTTNGSAPAPAIPGTPQDGDWLVAFFASREITDGTVSLPAGWDERVNSRGTGGLVACWTRPWQSGDTAPAFTLGGHATGASGDSASAVIYLVRPTAGSALSFVDASTPTHTGNQTQIGPIDGDSLTVDANGIVLLLGHFRETTVAIADASGDGLTWNQGTYISNSSGADQSLEIDWALNDNVAVTDKTLTLTTPGGSVGSAGFMIFLKEEVAAAPSIPPVNMPTRQAHNGWLH
jgi:hypothetical protein